MYLKLFLFTFFVLLLYTQGLNPRPLHSLVSFALSRRNRFQKMPRRRFGSVLYAQGSEKLPLLIVGRFSLPTFGKFIAYKITFIPSRKLSIHTYHISCTYTRTIWMSPYGHGTRFAHYSQQTFLFIFLLILRACVCVPHRVIKDLWAACKLILIFFPTKEKWYNDTSHKDLSSNFYHFSDRTN